MSLDSGRPYMDSNRMRQKTSSMGAGIISAKGFLDRDLIADWMAQAANKNIWTYPGGNREENHDANPGDMSMGLKNIRTDQYTEGGGSQLGVVGIGGLAPELFPSHRSMEGQFYFQGFCATSERVGKHHMDANTMETGNGYAMIDAGVANAPNNGPYMLYAGQLAMWRIPPMYDEHVRPLEGNPIADQRIVNQRNRNGAPTGQFKFELVPFDARDMTMYTAGAIANMAQIEGNYAEGGIDHVIFAKFFEFQGISDTPSVSCEAEEAGGRKFGFCGAGLAFVETLAQRGYITINVAKKDDQGKDEKKATSVRVQQLADEIGLWKINDASKMPAVPPVWYEAVQNMFFMDAINTSTIQEIKANFERAFGKRPEDAGTAPLVGNNAEGNYQKLRVHLSRFTDGSLIGSWYDKASKIVGRAANTTAPGDMAHIVARHSAI